MSEQQIWINGQFFDADNAKISVFDHGLLYGDGVFEGIRAYNSKILKLKTHLIRLFESARYISLNIPYTIEELEQATRESLQKNNLTDAYIRLNVTRGKGDMGLNPYNCKEPTTFIITGKTKLYPQVMYESGLEIVTASTIRNHPAAFSPRVKSMNYLNNIMAKIEGLNFGCIEAVMLNHNGYVSECTGDNIFIVKNGILKTPPLNAEILEGVTRNLVIKLAENMGVETQQIDITRHDIYIADECFLTGTAAEIIPVTRIDARDIADAVPGPITSMFMQKYRQLVANAPED